MSEKTKKKISSSKKGTIPWNKEKKMSKTFREKCKIRQTGKSWSPQTQFKKGQFAKEKHPMWKGGITLDNQTIRESLQYEIWRKEIYKRDRWICRMCNKKCGKKNIIAHHIKLFSEFLELRFSIDNGITVCRNCHAKIHYGKSKLGEAT